MGQAQINARTRACSRTFIARTKQAALTHHGFVTLVGFFDGFATLEFGENGHFEANLAPETM